MCVGDLELAVLGAGGDWTKISLHHGYTMRWKGPWSWSDVAFADPAGFMAWLADHGVTLNLDMEAEALARQREQEAHRTRWRRHARLPTRATRRPRTRRSRWAGAQEPEGQRRDRRTPRGD